MSVVVYIDQEHAKIFDVVPSEAEGGQITLKHSAESDHHAHRTDEMAKQKNDNKFYQVVAEKLTPANQVLILGHGLAKDHFKNYLVEKFPLIAKQVAGCETVDKPTDHQIVALAKKFFKVS